MINIKIINLYQNEMKRKKDFTERLDFKFYRFIFRKSGKLHRWVEDKMMKICSKHTEKGD